ncbi:MAG: hypothetical protein ACXWRE_07740 [Pseudobdellovibrionaceae bacterium]
MKKLTDTQKKWALTACLTTALSFNLIMSLAEPNYHSASFASSQGDGKTQDATAEEALPPAETKKTPKGKRKKKSAAKATTDSAVKAPPTSAAKVEEPSSAEVKDVQTADPKLEEKTEEPKSEVKVEETAKKSEDPKTKLVSLIDNKGNKIQVKYSKGENEEQTTATVAKMTESGPPCTTCGDTYLLPNKFESNATDLEAALRKAMSEKAVNTDHENAAPEVASNDGTDLDPEVQSRKEQRSNENSEEDKDIVDLKKKCENKKDDSRLECFANGLTNMLSDRSSNKKEHNKDEVLALFRDEIQLGLASGLRDVSDLVRFTRMRYDPFADVETDPTSRREKSEALLQDMISKISKKYNYLRQKLTSMAAEAVLANEAEAQRKLKQADQIKQTNPGQALKLQSEGIARMNASNQIANQIGGTLSEGLSTALDFNRINDDQYNNLLQDNYGNLVNQAIQGLAANPLTYVIPSVTLSDGSTLVDGTGRIFTLTSQNPLLTQQRSNQGIIFMGNGLTSGSIAPQNAPRISAWNGVSAPGTATIQVIQGNQVIPGGNQQVLPVGAQVIPGGTQALPAPVANQPLTIQTAPRMGRY